MLPQKRQVIRRRWWQNVALMAVLIAPMGGLVIANWDGAIVDFVQRRELPGDIEKTLQLSEAFAHGSGVIVIFSLLLIIDRNHRQQLWRMVAMVVVIMIVANLSKGLFSRARPYVNDQIDDLVGSWWPTFSHKYWDTAVRSFPSGHSATAAAMAFALANVYPRGRYIFGILAILACLQRVASRAHYPSDVLAGVTVAAAIALLWQLVWPQSSIPDSIETQIADDKPIITAQNITSQN